MRSIKALAASAAVSVVAVGGMALPANAQQAGLINVNVEDVTVGLPVQVVAQVPVGLAANVCNVNVALLVAGIADGGDDCTATAQSAADSRAFQNFRQRTGQ